jgi:hypothetical protein
MRRFSRTTKVAAGLLLMGIVLGTVARCCASGHTYPAINGVLLDAKNGKPIQGAAVAGIYGIIHGTVGGDVNEWVDGRETTTDAEGKFTLPEVSVKAMPFVRFHERQRILIFAAGYESVDLSPGRQAYSSVGVKKIPVGKDVYREESRPIMTVATNNGANVYEFRVSRLDTDTARRDDLLNHCFADVPQSLIPKLNEERSKYGYGASQWRTPAIDGLVVDAKDGTPVKYAVVAGIYGFHRVIPGDEPQGWINSIETITNAEGKFQLCGLTIPAMPFCRLDERPRICIFAPGYESVDFRGDCDQVYSRVGEKGLPVGSNASGTKGRPIVSVGTKNNSRIYEFRISPMDTEAARKDDLKNAFTDKAFSEDRACRCPQLFDALNRERRKYEK